MKTAPALAEPDVQLHFNPVRMGFEGRRIVLGQGYCSTVCLLKPQSRGELTLGAAAGELEINFNLLADSHDRERLLDGLVLMRKILAAPAFDAVRSPELMPGPEFTTREHLETYLEQGLRTSYHPVGTCRMGQERDPLSVVTPELKLIGSENIRVVDASVMPEVVAGNTNAPTMMIAEKGAEMILQEGKNK